MKLGMRRLSCLRVWVLLLAATAGAQIPNSNQHAQPPDSSPASPGAAPPAVPATNDQVTVTAPRPGQSLPALPPDEFFHCLQQGPSGPGASSVDLIQASICEHQLDWEKHIVVSACINRDGKTALPRVIQACTESLDHKIFEGKERFFLFADRAVAYFSLGDKEHALDDYNTAVTLAPKNAEVYYDRGVFYAAQREDDAALRDFDTAISIDAKFVAALRQRAKTYYSQKNFSNALADYSEAIRLQPKTAALWSERGHVCLQRHDYQGAVTDEAQALQLDPKLAQAYFLRGAAYADLHDPLNASNDLKSAVSLDPSLANYVKIAGKTASLVLPPL